MYGMLWETLKRVGIRFRIFGRNNNIFVNLISEVWYLKKWNILVIGNFSKYLSLRLWLHVLKNLRYQSTFISTNSAVEILSEDNLILTFLTSKFWCLLSFKIRTQLHSQCHLNNIQITLILEPSPINCLQWQCWN